MTGDSPVLRPPDGFRFLRTVAHGPVSVVFEAAAASASSPTVPTVLVKRLGTRGRSDASAVAAFAREAFVGRTLAGAGAHVPAFVRAGTDEAGPYLVVAKLPALPLAIDVAAGARRGAGWSAVARAAFAALATVHDAADAHGPLGVVHNDVHLDNVLFTGTDGEGGPSPRAFVVDFGLATVRADRSSRAASDGVFRGTVRYASPEAARGEETTPSSDRFSLAAALLHRASGVDPRGGQRESAALLLRAGSEPLDGWLEAIAVAAEPDVRELARVLASQLSFDAGDRRATPAW